MKNIKHRKKKKLEDKIILSPNSTITCWWALKRKIREILFLTERFQGGSFCS